jgi:uncharacterized protein YcbK (DUF882 family)
MGDLSTHFNRAELECKCGCGQNTVDSKLVDLLEKIRTHFDVPVHVTSGNRCIRYNGEVGGAEFSQHLKGKAADIVVDGIPTELVAELAHDLGTPGVGCYNDFVHIDVRDGYARW